MGISSYFVMYTLMKKGLVMPFALLSRYLPLKHLRPWVQVWSDSALSVRVTILSKRSVTNYLNRPKWCQSLFSTCPSMIEYCHRPPNLLDMTDEELRAPSSRVGGIGRCLRNMILPGILAALHELEIVMMLALCLQIKDWKPSAAA
jgi:hypothetical protein